jgi:nucleotide-binding universal stress UspA family protein
MAWKRICCAVDFSEPSRHAMAEAADLARRLAADLTLLHVYETHAPSPEVLLARYEQAAPELEGKLRTWQGEAERLATRPVRTVMFTGGAAAEILRFAGEGAFDLIVLATHGRTGLPRVVLGSVAERVVREAQCTVLVVRRRVGDQAA